MNSSTKKKIAPPARGSTAVSEAEGRPITVSEELIAHMGQTLEYLCGIRDRLESSCDRLGAPHPEAVKKDDSGGKETVAPQNVAGRMWVLAHRIREEEQYIRYLVERLEGFV